MGTVYLRFFSACGLFSLLISVTVERGALAMKRTPSSHTALGRLLASLDYHVVGLT